MSNRSFLCILLVVLFLAPTPGCKKSQTAEQQSGVTKLDANRLEVGQVGLPHEDGHPAKVTVNEVNAFIHGLIVDFHGQQWVLENTGNLQVVDGQQFEMRGKWRVTKRHYWNSTMSWYLSKVDD